MTFKKSIQYWNIIFIPVLLSPSSSSIPRPPSGAGKNVHVEKVIIDLFNKYVCYCYLICPTLKGIENNNTNKRHLLSVCVPIYMYLL